MIIRTNRSSGEVRKTNTDEPAILREQFKAQTVQIQALTERLSQYEKLQESGTKQH